MSDESEDLRKGLTNLFRYIERVRKEIAAINSDSGEEERFKSMGEQLDAIVNATEEATHTVMGRAEDNDNAVEELRKTVTDPDQLALLDRINANSGDVYQACSFQDITGQRVAKIVKSISYLEERISALIEIFGRDEIAKIEVEEPELTEDEKLLHGPALETEESLAQDDIDALFD